MMQYTLGTIKTASFGHQFTSDEINKMGISNNSRSFVLEEFTDGEECKDGDKTMLRKSKLQITCALEHQEAAGQEAHIILFEPNKCEHVFTLFLAEMCEMMPLLLEESKDEL